MFDVIYAEFIKLKRSKILLLIPLGGLIPALFMLVLFGDKNFHNSYANGIYGWHYFLDVTLYYANIVCPAFFAIFTGYIFTREYQLKTINTIFTYSFSRYKVFVAKLIVILPMILGVFLSSMLFTLIIGKFLDHDTLTMDSFLALLKINMQMVFINFLLIPLAALVSIIGKNIVGPIVLGISHLLSWVVLDKSYGAYIPGCLPSIMATHFTRSLRGNHPVMYHFNVFHANVSAAYLTLGVISLAALVIAMIYFRFSDVS